MMIHCDFCGKSQDEVFRLIAGPQGRAICSNCSLICASIVLDHMKSDKKNNKIVLEEMEECKDE